MGRLAPSPDRSPGMQSPDSPAARIVAQAGTRKGFCVDLAAGDGRLALDLVGESDFYVHALSADQDALAGVRRTLDLPGVYGVRASAERGDLARLPYPDYCANVITVRDVLAAEAAGLSWAEVGRILRPGGVVWARLPGGGAPEADALARRLRAAGLIADVTVHEDGVHALIRRARPQGMGQWTHDLRGGPGNNPCADDALVKAPFQTLWINEPRSFTKFGLVVAADGRFIMRHGGITHTGRWTPSDRPDRLQAFDGYNGAEVWEATLPAVGGNGLVAVGGAVYAEAGGTLVALDAADGRRRWQVAASAVADGLREWTTYACADGLLVAGLSDTAREKDRPPPIKVLVGLSAEDGSRRWQARPEGGPTELALGEGLVFYGSPAGHAAALEAATGRERWRTDHAVRGAPRYHRNRLFFDNAIFSAADGALVSRRGVSGIYTGDRAVTGSIGRVGQDGGVWAAVLATGERTQLFTIPRDPYSPKTGVPDGGIYGRCIRHTASTHCYFFHAGGTLIADLVTNTLFPTEAFRSNCRTGVIAGNGVVYNSASDCACTVAVRGNVALVPVARALYEAGPAAGGPALEKGPAYADALAPDDPTAWPCLRGDVGRSSHAQGAAALPLSPAWTVRLPGPLTAPAVAAGAVFVGSEDHSIYALDVRTGAQRWRVVTGGAVPVTPAWWRGRVYAGSLDGWVYCLSADDGRLVWRFRGGPYERKAVVFGRPESLWPIGGGVIVEDGRAYFYAGRCSHDRVFVYALDATTGAVIWRNERAGRAVEETGPAGGISPRGISPYGALAASADVLYVPHGPTFPAGFNKADGAIRWWNRRGNSAERSNINIQHLGGCQLAVAGRLLFAGGHNPFTDHRQRYIALDAATGRIWGQDHPALFEAVMRDPSGKTILPQNYKWGANAIHLGSGIAPVVAEGGVFTFDHKGATLSDLERYLAQQFGPPAADAPVQRWPRSVPADALIVAGRTVLAAKGSEAAAYDLKSGGQLWAGRFTADGAVAPNGLALAGGRLCAVTSAGEVACLAPPAAE